MILDNRYRIDGLLWNDGCTRLDRGYDQSLNRPVTVVQLEGSCATDPAAATQLLETARSLATNEVPHVIALYDQGELNGLPFLIFEEAFDQSLSEVLPLALGQTVALAVKLAETLRSAQAKALPLPVLTPQTVRYSQDRRIQVVYTGLGGASAATTPVAALGHFLHWAVTGRPGGSLGGTAHLPSTLRAVVERALSNGYPTLDGLVQDLQTIQQEANEPTITINPHVTQDIPLEAPSRQRPRKAIPIAPPRRGRRYTVFGLLGAVLLAGVAAGAFLLSRPSLGSALPTATVATMVPATDAPTVPVPAPTPGEPYVIATSDGRRLNVRRGPSLASPVVRALPNSTEVRVVSDPISADNFTWVRIQANGVDGWCVLNALRKK